MARQANDKILYIRFVVCEIDRKSVIFGVERQSEASPWAFTWLAPARAIAKKRMKFELKPKSKRKTKNCILIKINQRPRSSGDRVRARTGSIAKLDKCLIITAKNEINIVLFIFSFL